MVKNRESMGLGLGSAAMVTGAGSGIGRATSLALARRGVAVTVVDQNESDGLKTVSLIENEWAEMEEWKPHTPVALFCKCDVSVPEQLTEAFIVHERTYGRLDVMINNAGIGDDMRFYFWDDNSVDGTARWRKVIDVNLVALIDGTRLAIQFMRRACQPGVILNVASVAGLRPSYHSPMYSTTKAGVVIFTQSLAGLKSEGIRVNVLCPEHVYTNMTKDLPRKWMRNGFLPMDAVIKGAFELIDDETRAGACLLVSKTKGSAYWSTPEEIPREDETQTEGGAWREILTDAVFTGASYVGFLFHQSISLAEKAWGKVHKVLM